MTTPPIAGFPTRRKRSRIAEVDGTTAAFLPTPPEAGTKLGLLALAWQQEELIMAQTNGRDPNPAELRGDIQAGRTGDKRPGFDPAMAPLETDSEAGGTSLSAEQINTARATQTAGKPTDTSREFSDAMRETPGVRDFTPSRGQAPPPSTAKIVLVILAAALVVGAFSYAIYTAA